MAETQKSRIGNGFKCLFLTCVALLALLACKNADAIAQILLPISTTLKTTVGATDAAANSSNSQYEMQHRFVEVNMDNLARDIAQGNGDYLIAMAHLHGCPTNIHVRYGHTLQQGFGTLFPHIDVDADNLLHNMHDVILQDPVLADACKWVV